MRVGAVSMVLLCLSAHVASADDGGVAVNLGIGPAVQRWLDPSVSLGTGDDGWRTTAALHANVGVHVQPRLAIGVHLGTYLASEVQEYHFYGAGPPVANPPGTNTYRAFELGGGGLIAITSGNASTTASTTVADRVWVAPWIGATFVHASFTDAATTTAFAVGFDAGIDLLERFGVFAGVSHSGVWTHDALSFGDSGYVSVTFGVAYRMW